MKKTKKASFSTAAHRTPASNSTAHRTPPASDSTARRMLLASDSTAHCTPSASDSTARHTPPVSDSTARRMLTSNSTTCHTPPTSDSTARRTPPASHSTTRRTPPVSDSTARRTPPVSDSTARRMLPSNSTTRRTPPASNSTARRTPPASNSTVRRTSAFNVTAHRTPAADSTAIHTRASNSTAAYLPASNAFHSAKTSKRVHDSAAVRSPDDESVNLLSADDDSNSLVSQYNVPPPLKKKRKSYTDEQVNGAKADITDGETTTYAVSKKWGIPYTTLLDWKHGKYSSKGKPGPNPILNQEEEELLCQWVIELSRRGIPLNKRSLLDTVQRIIAEDGRPNPFINNRPGEGWFQAFLRRHPQLAQRHAESVSRSRAALTEGCIRGWFSDCKQFFEDQNIAYVLSDPTKQYNGDETGFRLDPNGGRVLGPKNECISAEAGGSKEQISVLITTRADGKMMPAVVIYAYKRAIPESIVSGMPEGFCAARSDSGWMNSDIFFEYMANCFIPQLNTLRREAKGLGESEDLLLDETDWVVYWLDGYSSHLTLHTSKLCDINKVVIYCFKAHSTHVCQPNDVGPFKPLKVEWTKAMTDWRVKNPYKLLTKVEFAPVLEIALSKLNPSAIVSGYRSTGLYPFNADAVHYEKLTTYSRRKPFKMPETEESAIMLDNEDQIALKKIEDFLGTEVVADYNRVYHPQQIVVDNIGTVNAYFVWHHFKKICDNSSAQQRDMECSVLDLLDYPYQCDVSSEGKLLSLFT